MHVRGSRRLEDLLLLKRIGFTLAIAAVTVTAALAADRHVYLDTNGDGILNDCPNPAHNAKGTSNTDNLQYCSGGTATGKVIGTATGRVSAAACTTGGGSVANVTNNSQVDVDGDGTIERVYGHPQACVYNMAPSDSCDVHAGTYRTAGAQCDEDCSQIGPADQCDKSDCFLATVVALGDGPNLNNNSYGTASAPGYLRGAVMNGVTDTWDANGDKNPSDGTYAAIFSGDRNSNGAFDQTTCSGNSCSGDSFNGVVVGCGGGSYGTGYCRSTPNAGTGYIKIDSNADGVFDTNVGTGGVKAVNNFIIKDIEFTRYNGGNGATSGGSRSAQTEAILALEGNGSSSGLKVDHVYMVDNDFSLSSPSGAENFWAYIADSGNGGCTGNTEIKNSFIVQNNEKVLDDDCGVNNECGCPKNVHDNRVLVDISSPRASNRINVFAYLKSIDTVQGGTRKKEHRIWNNEFIYKRAGAGYFLDLQAFGNSKGHGLGELWVYGNIFRNDASVASPIKRLWNSFCGAGTGSWRTYFFSNTFDAAIPLDAVCTDSGELMVDKNNAYLLATSLTDTAATTIRRSNDLGSTSATNRTVWFDPGLASPAVHVGLGNYRAKALGPLKGLGTCDPDGDGTPGVDYNGDGVNDTSWKDISGASVSCATMGSLIDIGAVQGGGGSPSPTDTTPPGNVQGLGRTDKN